jgi:hypothetical protein
VSLHPPSPEAACKTCGAPIFWADYTKKDGTPGKMPVDRDPTADGTIQLFRRPTGNIRAEVLTKQAAENIAAAARVLGSPLNLRKSHFATCPQAASFRGAR